VAAAPNRPRVPVALVITARRRVHIDGGLADPQAGSDVQAWVVTDVGVTSVPGETGTAASMTLRRLRPAGPQAAPGRVLGQLRLAGHRRASLTSGTLVPYSSKPEPEFEFILFGEAADGKSASPPAVALARADRDRAGPVHGRA